MIINWLCEVVPTHAFLGQENIIMFNNKSVQKHVKRKYCTKNYSLFSENVMEIAKKIVLMRAVV